MELPDVIAVTKADLGAPAERTRAELELALGLAATHEIRPRVIPVAAAHGVGLEDLEAAIAAHRAWLAQHHRLERRRQRQETAWIDATLRSRFGTMGLAVARRLDPTTGGPFSKERALASELARRLAS